MSKSNKGMAKSDPEKRAKAKEEKNSAHIEEVSTKGVPVSGWYSQGSVGRRNDSKHKDGRRILQESECGELAIHFPTWKKWLCVMGASWIELSCNYNTSVYANAVMGVSQEFGVSEQAARIGSAIYLIPYAFACELWAPLSEELGRWPTLQLSTFLINVWTLPVALAPNFGSLLVGRFLGGISTGGGSIAFGVVADCFEERELQMPTLFVVLFALGAVPFGPVIGGFLEAYLDWRWNIWTQLIFGGVVQICHFFFMPETRSTVIRDKAAKKRRKNGEDIYGPNELTPWTERFSLKEFGPVLLRPYKMLFTEPIVLTFSLLSGFSDSLIFMFLQSFTLVFKQYNFSPWQTGLVFNAIIVGYLITYAIFFIHVLRHQKHWDNEPEDEYVEHEMRLEPLLCLAPLLPIGLAIFAWTSTGPPIPWIAPVIAIAVISIANFAIYMATINYVVHAYGVYAASATGGNSFCRDFFAGSLQLAATPFYKNIGSKPLAYAGTVLFCIATPLVMCVYLIYWKGKTLRARSPFASQLAGDKKGKSK